MAGTIAHKTAPGTLDGEPTVLPLRNISPSRYEGILQCALREVWAAGKQTNLLPVSPVAQVGLIIHRLLEDAGPGLLGVGDQKAIELRWGELVRLTEERMRSNWLDRHLVPLKNQVADLEVRKIRAWNRAFEISLASSVSERRLPVRSKEFGTEIPVASRDGLVAGRIDRVIMSSEGPIIIDYKSGAISEQNRETNSIDIKPGYVRQLHLYAALYHASTGIWPVQLQLVPLSGVATNVEFDRLACSHLLNDAVETLNRVNRVIASSRGTDVNSRLANPNSSNCHFCVFRPRCRPYQRARITLPQNRDWPGDVWGVLTGFWQLSNSKLSIEVQSEELPGVRYYIRGLDPGVMRHPAIAHFHSGERIALYNLSGGELGKTYRESNLTTIYRVTYAGSESHQGPVDNTMTR